MKGNFCMNNNPFTLTYGIAPNNSIVSRYESIEHIVDSFNNESNMYSYIITGIRGSGKTVLLKSIEKELSNSSNWIILDINPQTRILHSLANKLYNSLSAKKVLGKISFSINLGIVTLTRESGDSTNDPEIIIEYFISVLKNLDIKLLISIDEVNNTQDFKEFINFYQIMLGKNLPMYLLMTGLQENINGLINDKAMTFLTRAPKIELEPLSLANIATNYANIFDISYSDAAKLAKLTKGYAFAYQVLGYLLFENDKKEADTEIIQKYENYLWNYGYNKFWQDLTHVEKQFLICLALSDGNKENIIKVGFPETNYSQYRHRLLLKGLISMPSQGLLEFVLPRFKEYVLLMKEFE